MRSQLGFNPDSNRSLHFENPQKTTYTDISNPSFEFPPGRLTLQFRRVWGGLPALLVSIVSTCVESGHLSWFPSFEVVALDISNAGVFEDRLGFCPVV